MFSKFRHGHLLGNCALALALAVAGTQLAAPAYAADKKEKAAPAPKMSFSKPFVAAAQPLEKAIAAAKTRADVVAAEQALNAATNAYNTAQGSAARKAAAAQRDAALAQLGAAVAPEKAQLEAALAVATVVDDKYMWGSLATKVGVLAQDRALIRRGYETSLSTGKYPAEDVPKVQNALGQMCYDLKDYACAQSNLTAALAAGIKGDSTEALLAESYIAQNQIPQGLDVLWKAISSRKAAGTLAPKDWYSRGLGVAYKNKLLDQASMFANGLVDAYPTKENWAGAIGVVRLVGKYEIQERLDLMRLMQRTGSLTEGTDYAEFIQAADPRRLPAEVLPVLEEGLKNGKLEAGDIFVSEARAQATARVAEERPTLPALEKSASAPTATGNSMAATADALLSYGQAAKAEALYNAALAKGGVDTDRVLTRIGIAQYDQAKYADAQATFAKVGGIRKPLAQLWVIASAQKAKGG